MHIASFFAASAFPNAEYGARKLLLKAMVDAKEGRDPQHIVREPKANNFLHLQVFSEVIPTDADIRQHTRERVRAVEQFYGK